MGRVIVISFVTLDGIVTDPDGSDGTLTGGWAFRYGRETIAGDKFELGPLMANGVALLGRNTWELFSTLWPNRIDDFSTKMNTMAKVVASRALTDVSAWSNSKLLDGDLADYVQSESRDIVVIGSLSVVRQLQEADLVDEYRLITFPSVIGTGEPLFPAGAAPVQLRLASSKQTGPVTLATYERESEDRS
jgi:dihydrofolate reductase